MFTVTLHRASVVRAECQASLRGLRTNSSRLLAKSRRKTASHSCNARRTLVTCAAAKSVLVTGGNTGIGLALCKQLAVEDGCHVYLGSRSLERGAKAVESILAAAPEVEGRVTLVELDASKDDSVAAAASTVKEALGEDPLYAVVNNAGTGLQHNVSSEQVIQTNIMGPKRVCEAFIPLLTQTAGRIVNVGSGSGPMYVSSCRDAGTKEMLCSFDVTWAEIEALLEQERARGVPNDYGLTKACLAAYTMLLARERPNLKINCVSPGFINTGITRGWGVTKPPEEGTVSIRHCLFAELEGNGWYYGSDAVRSPLDYLRNPGEPPYTG